MFVFARNWLAVVVVLVAVATTVQAQEAYPAARLGLVQSANSLIGTPVRDREGRKIAVIKDLITDFNSGRVYGALVAPANFYGNPSYFIAIPSQAFVSADGEGAGVSVGDTNLFDFPRFAIDPWETSRISELLQQSADQFGCKISVDPQARFVRASSLLHAGINNQSGVNIGTVSDLAVDLPAGRLLFAVASLYGQSDNVHAIPPAAFTVSTTQKTLTLNVSDARTATLVRPEDYLWTRLTDPAFVAASYRAFGHQLTFDNSPAFDVAAAQRAARAELPRPVEKFVPKDDADITHHILAAFASSDFDADSALRNVKVSVSNGKITLSGHVISEAQKNRIHAVAERAVGADNVIDQITVD